MQYDIEKLQRKKILNNKFHEKREITKVSRAPTIVRNLADNKHNDKSSRKLHFCQTKLHLSVDYFYLYASTKYSFFRS